MATTAPDSSDNLSWHASAMAFLNGPTYYVTIEDAPERETQHPLQPQQTAESGVPTAHIVLTARSTADLHSGTVPQKQASIQQQTSVKVQGKLAPRGPTTEGFDNNKQTYTKEELSPLPFQPPVFLTYATSMLSGAFKVFQYMITIMVALMVTQHSIERYWTSSGGPITSMQKLMLAVFLSYPLVTLLLVILSSNEIAIRRFMYYRLMSLQVIVDWQNTPFYKLWFFSYFLASFVLINVYTLYASVITRNDNTSSVFPQWSIMVMQSLLLFMFWLNMVSMEDQLVPLNKVIENSPESAKELITLCDVVKEAQLKAVVKQAYKRKKAFKRLPDAEQDAAGHQLMELGDSSAAFFDLNALRKTSKRRGTQEDLTATHDDYEGCWCAWMHNLNERLHDLTFRKLYAWYFCLSFFSISLTRLRRSGQGRAAASLWPFAGDIAYFWALGIIGSACFLTVVAVEAYALWFLLFATDISDRDKYGIIDCKHCYNYLSMAGQTCSQQAATDKCWSVAMRSYCSVQDALTNSYGANSTQVDALNGTACLTYIP